MDIPDGFLSGPVAGATWAAGAGGLAIALRAERREREHVPAGVLGALVGAAVASMVGRLVRGYRGVVAGAVFGAFVSTVCGAVPTALWLAASGLYPLAGVLPLMLVTHTAIGVLEGALTGAIVAALLRWRPDLVTSGAGLGGTRAGVLAAGVLGVALVVAAFLAPLASSLPDGLEQTALALGFGGYARPLLPATLEGAPFLRGSLARVAPLVAGVLGTLLAALVAYLAGRGLSRADHVPHA